MSLRRELLLIAAFGAGVSVLPLLPNSSAWIAFITLVLVYAIFTAGFDLVFGGLGLLSLGHAALFGCGAFVLAILTTRLGWSFGAASAVAVAASALLALGMGLVALRLSGIFLALVTLALAQLLYDLSLTHLRPWTGGFDGLTGVPRPVLFAGDTAFMYLALLLALLVFAGIAVLRASPFGRVVEAVRQNPVRAAQLGLDVQALRLRLFALSGAVSGLAGALCAAMLNYASPEMLMWTVSGDVVIMAVLGGSGTLFGPLLGVMAYELLRELLSSTSMHWRGVLGIVFILITLLAPGGVVGVLAGLLRWRPGR